MSRDAESSTHRSPAQLAAYVELFDRVQDCVLILDGSDEAPFTILDINRSGLQLFGQASKEKLLGRSLLQWIDASSRQDFAHAVRVSIRRTDWHRFDAVWKVAEDRTMTMEISASPLYLSGQQGQATIQLIARDVSSKREAEQLIQLLRQKLALSQAGAALSPMAGGESEPSFSKAAKVGR